MLHVFRVRQKPMLKSDIRGELTLALPYVTSQGYSMSLVASKSSVESEAKEESFDISEVKYELNTVENMKTAKENVSRSETFTMIQSDIENIRFELQSGVYIEVKIKTLE